MAVKGTYPESPEGFKVVDSIGVPHPYCITPKHVEVAADQFMGRLGEAAIVAAEKQGAKCGICKGELPYHGHEQALLVEVPKGIVLNGNEALHAWLKAIVEEAGANGYVGFAFKEGE